MPSDPDGGATPIPHEHVVFTDLDGIEGVLVDLDTKQYFQLNATASLIWRGLARGAAADQIARELTDEFDVTPEHARRSVDAAIADFTAKHLVTSRRARTAP
jgi:hypothetical protein